MTLVPRVAHDAGRVLLPFSLPSPNSRPFDLVAFGENSVDLVATTDGFPLPDGKQRLDSLERLPGGQIATAAVAAARLGCRTRYVGTFGDDDLGRTGVASLTEEGVDTSACRTVAGATTRSALVLVDSARGTRSVLWQRDPRLSVSEGAVPATVWTSGRVLLVDGTDLAAATEGARVARASGACVVADLENVEAGTADLLAQVDVLIASARFPERLTGLRSPEAALAAVAARFGTAVVVVTLGERGSAACAQGAVIHTPAVPVTCVDSTGAGDAFHGGFIAACLGRADGSLEDALRFANAVAAMNCRAVGARGGLPHADEVR